MQGDDLCLALQLDRRPLVEAAVIPRQQTARGLGDQNVVARLARHVLDPRRRVDGIADHRELEVPAAADCPRDDGSRVDTDADAQHLAVGAAHDPRDLERRGRGAVGVIGQVHGGAEDAEQAVADVLVGVPAVLDDHGYDELVELVKPCHDLAGARPFGERREVADVEEQDRYLDLLASQR